MNKKIISAVCAIALVFGTVASPVADNGLLGSFSITVNAAKYGDLTYSVSGDNATIESCKSAATEVTIPAEIDGHTVVWIAADAFDGCDKLITVNIEANIHLYGDHFYDCPSLMNINVADGNEYCSSVDGMLIDGKLGSNSCELLCCPAGRSGKVVIPDGITCIDKYAFTADKIDYGYDYDYVANDKITEIVLPSSIKTVSGFSGMTGLKKVTIPEGPTSIEGFSGCTALTDINIPASVTRIESFAFNGCSALENIRIPDTVNYMGGWIFQDCTGLKSVILPENLSQIRSNTFQRCTSLESIVISSVTKTVSDFAFDGCTSLKDVYYTGEEKDWKKMDIYSNNNPLKNATIHYDYEYPAEVKIGDIDGDGKITNSDLLAVKSHIKGIKKLTGDALKAADVNNDGKVNNSDLIAMKAHIKGVKKLW